MTQSLTFGQMYRVLPASAASSPTMPPSTPEAGDARPPAGPSARPSSPSVPFMCRSLCGGLSPSWDESSFEEVASSEKASQPPPTCSATPLCSCSPREPASTHTRRRDVTTAASSFPVTSSRAGLLSATFWTHNPCHSAWHTADGCSTN